MCVTFRRDRKEDLSSLMSFHFSRGKVGSPLTQFMVTFRIGPSEPQKGRKLKPSQLEIAFQLVRPLFPLSNLKVIAYSCLANMQQQSHIIEL